MLNNTGRTANPLDRNNDGKVDIKDLAGSRPADVGLAGNTSRTANPLDRNNDGRVDARDFQSGGARHNPLDRNFDGKVDARDLNPNAGLQQQRQGLNPLDRNGDGRVDARDFQSGVVRQAPLVREQIEKEVVVHEHIHPVMKEEIQPVIYREREQLDVRQITQQLHETQIQPTLVQQRELAPEFRQAIVERGAPIQENIILPTVDRDVTMRSQVVHQPIVNETIKKTVIEEIQPVLERDIIQSTLIQQTQPIYEKVVEAPAVFREVRVVQERGITGGSLESLTAQGFNIGGYSQQGFNPLDRNHDGRVDARDFSSGQQQGMMGHNPLDRNFDGKVDARDLQSGGARHNPLDRNFDGRVDAQDLRPNAGQQGMRHNPLDRNFDGKVDAQDLRPNAGLGQQQQQGMGMNPLDRNHDGKVDLKDLSGNKAAPVGQQPPLKTLF